MIDAAFHRCSGALPGMTVSHVWRGHGSALFLEFGALTPRKRRGGEPANPGGEISLMIQGSWRIECGDAIVCGSWSDEALWEPCFAKMVGKKVIGVSTFGRLPEIAVSLEDEFHVLSFMTADGAPEWGFLDHKD